MKGIAVVLLLASVVFDQSPTQKSSAAAKDLRQKKVPAADQDRTGPDARLARSTGNLLLERLLIIKGASANEPKGMAARRRLAANAMESGDNSLAIDILTTGQANANGVSPTRDDQLRLGEAYLHSGSSENAQPIFLRLENIADTSKPDDAAVGAIKGLDALSLEVPETEHLKRAAIYQANRDFALAREHFRAVIDGVPTGTNAADSALQIGRGYSLATDYAEGINWYERVLEQYPQTPAANDALLQAASGYSRVGKPKEAIKRYQRFIEMYPADPKLDRAYLNIADIYRDQGEDREALKWCAKAAEIFKGRPSEAVALFATARIYIARGEWGDALDSLDRVGTLPDLSSSAPGGTDQVELAFLRGMVLEEMGRIAEAIDAYLSLPNGRDIYYGEVADRRLRQLAQQETGRGYIDQKIGAFSATLGSADTAARERAAQGILRLTDQADVRARASSVLKKVAKPADALALTRSKESSTAGKLPILQAEAAFRKVPADTPIDQIPADALRELYPTPFAENILRSSRSRGLDPRFVLSIMRQESRFDTYAHSAASARGLMQMIMSTANSAAGTAGQSAVEETDLYDPAFSIVLGSQHLSDLFKLFPEQPEAVAAAYNASAENVKRWTARARASTPDRYVPEIMFSQTKDYVKKVMANYRMYQYLYDADLRPR